MRDTHRSMAILGVVLLLGFVTSDRAEGAEGVPTFAKDVAPILYENCVSCHRPNHLAPMSLLTYNDTRPWARAVKSKVLAREMPPWGADSSIRAYKNDASLTQTEIDTIAAWVDGGAVEGNNEDLPATPQFAEGWSIGEPDLVFTFLEPFAVPADGIVPYSYVTVPTNLKEDTWISAHEFRPDDRRVVHHVISRVLEDDGKPATANVAPRRDPDRTPARGARVGGYVPNRLGSVYEDGVAVMLPAGADIEAQMHYTTIGEPVLDQSSWGVVLAPLALGSRPTRRSASTRIVAGSTPTASNSGPAMPSFCVSSAINRCAGMICGLPAVVAACIAEVSAAWVFVVGLNESTTPPFIGGKNACPLAQRSQG